MRIPEGASVETDNPFRGMFTAVTSPVIEQVLTATQQDFLYGQPNLDFGYHETDPLTVQQLPPNMERHTVGGVVAWEMGEAFARNFRHTNKTDFNTA